MKSPKLITVFLVLLVLYPAGQICADPTKKEMSVLAEALDLMREAEALHPKSRTKMGQKVDEIFGKNLEKLKQKGVIEKAGQTFMGDNAAGTYKVGKNMEIWIRKQTRGTKTSLDMVVWEFKRDKNGKLTSIVGKGLDTYTEINKDYKNPVLLDSRVKRSLESDPLSPKDAKTQQHGNRSHFGRKITTGQEWVKDISTRLHNLDPDEIKKLKIPGIENMDPKDFKKVHVEMIMDQEESFLWADKSKKSADAYEELRKKGAARSKLHAENELKKAKVALARAQKVTGSGAAKKLAEAEELVKDAAKKLGAAEEYAKRVNPGGAKPPAAKSPKPGRISSFKTPGAGGAVLKTLAGLGVGLTILSAADVVYASQKLSDSAIIKGPSGIEKKFERGEFGLARNRWKKMVSVSTRKPVADELRDALMRACAGPLVSVIGVEFEVLMMRIYNIWEKEAKKEFKDYKLALQRGPAKYEDLPPDADIRMTITAEPLSKVLAGEKVSVKGKIVVYHKLADYSQPVLGAPIHINWQGPNSSTKKITTNAKGEFTAGDFVTGKTVADNSLGGSTNRTKLQASFHKLVVAIVEKMLIKSMPVDAYDYQVARLNPPAEPDLAHANDKDSIFFDFKLQRRFIGEDGDSRLEGPVGYKKDFDKIGIYGGGKDLTSISISLNAQSYQRNINAVPDDNNGLFKVYAKTKYPGSNLIRLDLRGGKFRTAYLEVGRYPMEFMPHPVNFRLQWGAKMTKYVKDKHVILPKAKLGALVEYPLQVIALSNVDGKPIVGAEIEINVDPKDGINTAYTSYLPTNAKGEGIYKKPPMVYKINSAKARIIASAKGATNTLFAYTSERAPDKLGQARLIDQGAFTRVFKGSFPKSEPKMPKQSKEIPAGKGRLVLIARDAANKNIEPRVSIRRAGAKQELTYSWGGYSIDLDPGEYDLVFDYTPDIVRRVTIHSGAEEVVMAGGYGRMQFDTFDAVGKAIEPRVSIRRAGEKQEFAYSWGRHYIDLPPGKYDVVLDYTPDIEHKNIVLTKDGLIIVQTGGYGRFDLQAFDALGKKIEPRVSIRRAGEKQEYAYSWGGHYIDLPPGGYDLTFDYTPDIEKQAVLSGGRLSTVSAGGYGRFQLNAKDALGKKIEPRVSIRKIGEKQEFAYSWGGSYIDLPPGSYDLTFDYTPDIEMKAAVLQKGKVTTLSAGGYGRLQLNAKNALGKDFEPRVSIRRSGSDQEFAYSWGGSYIDLPPGPYDVFYGDHHVKYRNVVLRAGKVKTLNARYK